MEQVERGLAYEIVWVDNGSNETERHALHREFAIEKALFLGTNYGMAYGFNSLFFRLCSSPYFLTLEEDWEWLGDKQWYKPGQKQAQPPVGQRVLGDAISVLKHDKGLSGVFLRPDTLDQFLKRGEWQRAPRRGLGRRRAADVGSSSSGSSSSAAPAEPMSKYVSYAKYCMDRGASYLWGAYSNGPGVYDRERLMRRVGRQFGEPTDKFPDPASESNYAYRVGAVGLCSAILRIWKDCNGVRECNAPLVRHLGDERSHGYGKGRMPDVRWLVLGNNHSYDETMVEMRSLDVEPTMHWMNLYLQTRGASSEGGGEEEGESGEEEDMPPLISKEAHHDGRIAILIGARSASLQPIERMIRALLRASHAPERLEFLWLLPPPSDNQSPSLDEEGCKRTSARLSAEITSAPEDLIGAPSLLTCLPPHDGRDGTSLPERFTRLAEATDAKLLMLAPRLIRSVAHQPQGEGAASYAAEVGVSGDVKEVVDTPPTPRWDQRARSVFGGNGDVRQFPKDRVLLLQGRPQRGAGSSTPSTHVIVHRDALGHLGYFAPPVGKDTLLFTLWLQQVYGSVGRHQWIEGFEVMEEEAEEGEEESGGGKVPKGEGEQATLSVLRTKFDRSVGSRAIDTHRIDSLLLLLKRKSRTAYEGAQEAYKRFANHYNRDEIALAWPVLSEVLWCMESVERSEDWELRDGVSSSMLPAALELQGKLLDRFAEAATTARSKA